MKFRQSIQSLLAVFFIATIAATASSQALDRERLTEPVYREPAPTDAAEEAPLKTAARPNPVAPSTMANTTAVPTAPSQPTTVAPATPAPQPLTPQPLTPTPSTGAAAPAAAEPEPQQVATAVAQAPREPSSQEIFDGAIGDADKMLASMRANVKDYTCDMIKRECINGKLNPSEYMTMKVRNRIKDTSGNIVQPFSVYLKFKLPKKLKGREVLFVEGKNKGKMLVKEGGTAGKWLPAVWIEPGSSLAMKDNRYPITEIGLENLAARLIENGRADRTIDECQIRYQCGAKVDGNVCNCLEIVRPTRSQQKVPGLQAYVTRVFLNIQSGLPIRYAAYDWPKAAGARPEPMEEYTYRNIQLNPGLTDLDFDKENPEYSF